MKRKHLTEVLGTLLEMLMLLACYMIMCAGYAYANIGMQRISRTFIIVSLVFFVAMLVLTKVYGAFRVGQKRKRTILSSQFYKLLFTDGASFVALQIMNTNPGNPEANARLVIFDKNIPLTLAIFAVQLVVSLLLLELAFAGYYRINPPQRCLIVASSQEDADHLVLRFRAYPKDFRVTEAMWEDCPDWQDTFLRNDAIVLGRLSDANKQKFANFCYENRKVVYSQANAMEIVASAAEDSYFLDTAFINLSGREPTLVQRSLKRGFDIAFSLFLLIVLSPLLLFITLVLALSHNGSVLFRQDRRTKDGKIFRIMKFRTMYVDAAQNVSMNKHDDRITPFGRFLRRYRLDELPQLLNILKGEMSIVGPRPEMLENADRYLKETPEFRYRERMRAGITGFAQLEGAYDTASRDKAMLDLMYIEKFSLALDAKLILRTFTVFLRKDNEGFSKQETNIIPLRMKAKHRKEAR